MTGPSLTALVAAILAFGCAQAPPLQPAPTILGPPVGLSPGDVVRVEIWQEPDLGGEFPVSEAGIVVFPLLGERHVTGIETRVLEGEVTEDYRKYLVNPSVNITALKRIAIMGEVQRPGLYPVDATITLTDALALAGGVNSRGNREDIRLVRDGVVIVGSLNAASPVENIPMMSGDQIEVGPKGWFSRNAGYVTVAIASMTSLVVAMIVYR